MCVCLDCSMQWRVASKIAGQGGQQMRTSAHTLPAAAWLKQHSGGQHAFQIHAPPGARRVESDQQAPILKHGRVCSCLFVTSAVAEGAGHRLTRLVLLQTVLAAFVRVCMM